MIIKIPYSFIKNVRYRLFFYGTEFVSKEFRGELP